MSSPQVKLGQYVTDERMKGMLRIRIEHPLGLPTNALDQIPHSVGYAQNWLVSAFDQLLVGLVGGHQVGDFCRYYFLECFGTEPNHQHLTEVHKVLQQIYRGLTTSPLELRIQEKNIQGAQGEKKGGAVAARVIQPMKLGIIPWGPAYCEVSGAIQLDPDRLMTGDRGVKTLIHEAGHKFAKLIDNEWSDWPVDPRQKTDWKKLRDKGSTKPDQPVTVKWNNARNNADSYAMFVYYLQPV